MPENTATAVAIDDLPALAGRELGTSRWVTISQDDIDRFAALTGDRQWIHVDPERARRTAFKGTVAHGFFTLSLSTVLIYELVDVHDAGQILNYGLNRVRFPAATPAGSRVRMTAQVVAVDEVPGGYQVLYGLVFERDGGLKPVAVAELIFRYSREAT